MNTKMIFERAKFLYSIITSNFAGKKIPLTVSLAITARCNYRCAYCYGEYFNRKDQDIPLKTWVKLIDEISRMGTQMVHLGGGEPLLYPHIKELIREIKNRNMICRINSNGSLIPRKIEEIKDADSICVSLDGGEEANDKNRGQGTFKEIIAGIRCAKSYGMPTHVSATITNNNIETLDEILEIAFREGFLVEFGLPYEQSTSNKDHPSVKIQDEKMREFLAQLLDRKKRGFPIFYSPSTYRYALNWPVSYSKKMILKSEKKGHLFIKCRMGEMMCFVDSDGFVYPCGQVLGSFPALNFLDAGFKQAWENLSRNKQCLSCYCPCFTEFNQVFALKPGILLSNFLREIKIWLGNLK